MSMWAIGAMLVVAVVLVTVGLLMGRVEDDEE